jgi:hypothetical protein
MPQYANHTPAFTSGKLTKHFAAMTSAVCGAPLHGAGGVLLVPSLAESMAVIPLFHHHICGARTGLEGLFKKNSNVPLKTAGVCSIPNERHVLSHAAMLTPESCREPASKRGST